MSKRATRLSPAAVFLAVIFSALAPPVFSRTLRVPADFATIRWAVLASQDGDTVEVADGVYLEDNIVIDKAICVRAEHIYGAVIYGIQLRLNAVFIVRAAASIEGFVIKNARVGLMQRDSPDVEWTGRDLAFFNIHGVAVDVNDAAKNVGRARLSRIIVDGSGRAFGTNDANGIRVEDSLVTHCGSAFAGGNHLFFHADRTVVLNCARLAEMSEESSPHGGTNEIELGREVHFLAPQDFSKLNAGNIENVLFRFFKTARGSSPDDKYRLSFFNWFSGVILGQTCEGRGAFGDAREAYLRALAAGQSMGSEDFLPRVYEGLARVAEQEGDSAKALGYSREAVGSIEKLRARLPLRIYKEGFLLDKFGVYDRTLALLFRMHEARPENGYDWEAFRIAEGAKAGGFLESLWRLRADLHAGLSPSLQARKEDITRRTSEIQARLQDPSLTAGTIRDLSDRLERAEAEFNTLLSELTNRKIDATGPLPEGRPSFVRGLVEGRLDPNTALVLYAVGTRETYALGITSKGLRFARIGESTEVRSLVENYVAFLQDGPSDRFKGAAGGRRLYDRLLSSVLGPPDAAIRKLVVIPDDVLWYLPFEALVRDGGDPGSAHAESAGPPRFLVEDMQVAYAPSISYLFNLIDRRPADDGKMDLLALADEERRIVAGFSPDITYRLPSLHFAANEVRGIARDFSAQRSKVYIDDQISERSFKELPLADYRIIHLATHGFFTDEKWWRSALVLPRAPGSSDDGLLQTLELYGLTLRADLVVLSGCQTAMGQLSRGEGLMGLTGAFMAAGAQSVLSSLWSVDDKSTAKLMAQFYRFLTEGKTEADALRSCKLVMLKSPYRHPYYWATFVLSGDCDRPVNLKGTRIRTAKAR